MLGRCGGRVLLVYGAFPLLSTLRYNSAVEFQQRPTILMMPNTHFNILGRCGGRVLHVYDAFATAQNPPAQRCRRISTTPNDPYDAKHAFQQAQALRWSWVTRIKRISTA